MVRRKTKTPTKIKDHTKSEDDEAPPMVESPEELAKIVNGYNEGAIVDHEEEVVAPLDLSMKPKSPPMAPEEASEAPEASVERSSPDKKKRKTSPFPKSYFSGHYNVPVPYVVRREYSPISPEPLEVPKSQPDVVPMDMSTPIEPIDVPKSSTDAPIDMTKPITVATGELALNSGAFPTPSSGGSSKAQHPPNTDEATRVLLQAVAQRIGPIPAPTPTVDAHRVIMNSLLNVPCYGNAVFAHPSHPYMPPQYPIRQHDANVQAYVQYSGHHYHPLHFPQAPTHFAPPTFSTLHNPLQTLDGLLEPLTTPQDFVNQIRDQDVGKKERSQRNEFEVKWDAAVSHAIGAQVYWDQRVVGRHAITSEWVYPGYLFNPKGSREIPQVVKTVPRMHYIYNAAKKMQGGEDLPPWEKINGMTRDAYGELYHKLKVEQRRQLEMGFIVLKDVSRRKKVDEDCNGEGPTTSE